MPGLRERKKARTREEIIDAALSLFESKGFDATTLDEVAAAADVSPRTVFRYFTSKEDLVFFGQDEENRQIVALVSSMPRGTKPLDAMMRVARSVLLPQMGTPDQLLRSQRLIQSSPTLRAHKGQMLRQAEALFSSRLLSPRASKRDRLRTRLIGAVFFAALDVVMEGWIDAGAKGTPAAELDEVEAMMRRAFPS